jgi:hypothetical protein
MDLSKHVVAANVTCRSNNGRMPQQGHVLKDWPKEEEGK